MADQCTAKAKTTGRTCTRPVVKGAVVCRFHGGAAPQVRAAAARRVAAHELVVELERLGIPVETDPTEALLNQLAEAAGNVRYLRGELQRQQQAAVAIDRPSSAPLVFHGPQSMTVAPLVSLYGDWCDRVARLARLALDAGVNERAVALAERLGGLLADTLDAALGDSEWELTAEQRAQGRLVLGRHLQAVG